MDWDNFGWTLKGTIHNSINPRNNTKWYWIFWWVIDRPFRPIISMQRITQPISFRRYLSGYKSNHINRGDNPHKKVSLHYIFASVLAIQKVDLNYIWIKYIQNIRNLNYIIIKYNKWKWHSMIEFWTQLFTLLNDLHRNLRNSLKLKVSWFYSLKFNIIYM